MLIGVVWQVLLTSSLKCSASLPELLVQANIQYALSPAIKRRRESMPNVFTDDRYSPPSELRSSDLDEALIEHLQVPTAGSRQGSISGASSRRGSTITAPTKRDSCSISWMQSLTPSTDLIRSLEMLSRKDLKLFQEEEPWAQALISLLESSFVKLK